MNSESFLGRVFGGFWRFLNGARLVFLNLIFFVFLMVVVLAILVPDEKVRLQSETTLVLRPYGNVVEEFSTTPFDRALQQAVEQVPMETRLRDLVAAIDRAGKDSRIKQIMIDTDYLLGIGLSSLLDLERAVEDYKSSGKTIIAMGDAMGQHQYYLAALADEIWLNPGGMVWIDGYANIRQFYREGLDKLAVEINLFRVGEYKSAMEPFIRDDMSEEAKEASLYWLGSLWETYLDGVARHRGLPPSKLGSALREMPERIEAANGDLARFAIEEGLVDRLISRPEARQELALRGRSNLSGDGYRAIGMDDYLALTGPNPALPSRHDVKVLVAEGEILRGKAGPGTISAETTAAQLREIGREAGVRAIVLRVNSPGGDAMASEQIRRELQALQEAGKTVVVSMGDVAASGGYWISMGADEIWASGSTITGSIGVFGMIPTFGATLEKIGVRSDGVGTTELAGKLRVDRPLDDRIKRIFQSSTEKVYEDFIQRVSAARGLTLAEADRVARGRVWSGRQAQEKGLVDQLGGLEDAVDAAARIAGLGSDYTMGYYEPLMTPFESFMMELTSGVLAQWPVSRSTVAWQRQGFVQSLLDDLNRIMATEGRFTVAAHCLCEVR